MIIQNAIKVKDEIINSIYPHDFQEHDGVFIDGGRDYFRSNAEFYKSKFHRSRQDVEDLRLTDEDSFEVIKNNLVWGTYGKNGDQPLKWVKLIECETDHLLALVNGGWGSDLVRKVIASILIDRRDKKQEEVEEHEKSMSWLEKLLANLCYKLFKALKIR